MRTLDIFIVLLAITFASSCSTYCYIETCFADDMSVRRSVYTDSSSWRTKDLSFLPPSKWKHSEISDPFDIDFYDVVHEMNHVSAAYADDISSVSFLSSTEPLENPVLCPEETITRRFRWFYTYYDYRAVFRSLNYKLPLSFEGYLTEEQKKLFFTGKNPPEGWNGVEMYCLLDKVNSSFADWYSDVVYLTMCNLFEPYCSDVQIDALYSCKQVFMEETERKLIFAMTPMGFEEILKEIAPHAGFGNIFSENEDELTEKYDEKTEIFSYFSYSFLHRLDMPGKYYDGNATSFIDAEPVWKVDAFRLLDGDLVLMATFRKLNIWVFVLTFSIIILLLQYFSKLFSK